MNKEPIFYIDRMQLSVEGKHWVISGKALDTINYGDRLFISSEITDNDHFLIDYMETKETQLKRAYAFMDVIFKARFFGGTRVIDQSEYLYDVVDEYSAEITFKEAKAIAEEDARKNLYEFREDISQAFLREEFLEAECCWIFFRNKEITGPPERALTWDCAYAVSKKGNCYTIADRSDEPEELNKYISHFSSHLKRRKE